jgi:hypothetical protein
MPTNMLMFIFMRGGELHLIVAFLFFVDGKRRGMIRLNKWREQLTILSFIITVTGLVFEKPLIKEVELFMSGRFKKNKRKFVSLII